MYRTAVICDEISQDLVTACALAKQYGLDGMEIRTVNEKNPFQMDRRDAEEIRKICDDSGLAICAVGAPFFKCSLDSEEEYREHLEGLRRCAEEAHLWGTDLVRGFTFWKTADPRADFPRIADRYQEAIRIAKECGIRTGCSHSMMLATKRRIRPAPRPIRTDTNCSCPISGTFT